MLCYLGKLENEKVLEVKTCQRGKNGKTILIKSPQQL
jgi:hypothetical protein